jgi:hypothetical protein
MWQVFVLMVSGDKLGGWAGTNNANYTCQFLGQQQVRALPPAQPKGSDEQIRNT